LHESVDNVTRRIGETIRAHRLARNLSGGELARAAGLSKSALTRIEAAGGNPSVETLWRLARALGLPLGALLGEPARPRVRLIPARDGEPLRADDGMSAWLLHAEGRSHRAEVFELELPAGSVRHGEPHLPGTEELLVCTEGRIEAGPVDDTRELGVGDAIVFQCDTAHRYRPLDGAPARALNWMLYTGTPA
jgi:transcriptional regulator with XRE-family HTH domain